MTLRTFLREWTFEERAFHIGSALAEQERAEEARKKQSGNGSGDAPTRTISGEEYMRLRARGEK